VPVILATWEAEIGRMEVQAHPGQIVHETPISKITRAKVNFTKHKALSSDPSPTGRDREREKERHREREKERHREREREREKGMVEDSL
jgi:hypothetical protein